MNRIDHPTAVNGLFTEGNPSTSQPATTVTATFMNDVQEEICNVIENAAGGNVELDGDSQGQLLVAIQTMIDAAVADIEIGEGGTNTGIVKITQGTLGSAANTTSTSNVVGISAITHSPIDAANHKLIDCGIDWDVYDTGSNQAKGYAVLQGSSDNSSWSDLYTFTKQFLTVAGKALVKTQTFALSTTHTTNSTSNVDSLLAANYTPIAGANTRIITVVLDHKATDSNGGGANATAVLQYYNGSSWIDLKEMPMQIVVGGISSPNVSVHCLNTVRVVHDQSDSSPQYRVVHRANSGDTSEIAETISTITIEEFAAITVSNNRSTEYISYRDTTSRATAYYRLVHRVESGDTSSLAAGSFLRCKEVQL